MATRHSIPSNELIDEANSAALAVVSSRFEGKMLKKAEKYIRRTSKKAAEGKDPWRKWKNKTFKEELIYRALKRGPKCPHQFVVDETKSCRSTCKLCPFKRYNHEFCADERKLNRIACLHCDHPAATSRNETEDNKLLRYLSARRKRRHLENLYSLSLPISARSFHLVNQIMHKVGVTSNIRVLHVTLLEGVAAPSELYFQQVAGALARDPTCVVLSLMVLPTVNASLRLIIANVEVPFWTAISKRTATTTRLPQWPTLHISLGTIPAARQKAAVAYMERKLVGQYLETAPQSLAWLAPSQQIGLKGR